MPVVGRFHLRFAAKKEKKFAAKFCKVRNSVSEFLDIPDVEGPGGTGGFSALTGASSCAASRVASGLNISNFIGLCNHKEANEIQRLECTNNCVPSNCERYTLLFGVFLQPRTEASTLLRWLGNQLRGPRASTEKSALGVESECVTGLIIYHHLI